MASNNIVHSPSIGISAAAVTTSSAGADAEPRNLASPPYVTTIWCVPRLMPGKDSMRAPLPSRVPLVTGFPSTLTLTEPVGIPVAGATADKRIVIVMGFPEGAGLG